MYQVQGQLIRLFRIDLNSTCRTIVNLSFSRPYLSQVLTFSVENILLTEKRKLALRYEGKIDTETPRLTEFNFDSKCSEENICCELIKLGEGERVILIQNTSEEGT